MNRKAREWPNDPNAIVRYPAEHAKDERTATDVSESHHITSQKLDNIVAAARDAADGLDGLAAALRDLGGITPVQTNDLLIEIRNLLHEVATQPGRDDS